MRRLVFVTIFGVVSLAAAGACVGDASSDGEPTTDAGTGDGASPVGDGASGADAALTDAGTVDAAPLRDGGPITPPRPIAPLSTATVSKQAPTFHWDALPAGVDGVRVEICADRACATVQQSFDATGTSGKPPTALAKGIHYWRLRSKSGALVSTLTGPTWELRVRATDATVADTSWGSFSDFNGDGFSDVAALVPGPAVSYYLGGATLGGQQSIAQATQAQNDHELAYSLGTGDVNGDGFADLVVGSFCNVGGGAPYDCNPTAPVADGGMTSNGHAYVYFGSLAGLSLLKGPDVTIDSPDGTQSESFASPSVIAGDVNGDGYADVVAAAPQNTGNAGRIYVFNGGPQGPVALSGTQAVSGSDGFGYVVEVAPIGDVNGDGFADVAVNDGVSHDVFVFFGSKSGLVPAGNPARLTRPASANNSSWGRLSAVPGDTNGDGLCDLVVSTPDGPPDAGAAGPGLVAVFLGQSGLSLSSWAPSATLVGTDGNGVLFGAGMSLGDFNGDGYDDTLVSEYGYDNNAGRVYAFNGSSKGVSATGAALNGTGYFGIFVSAGLDINGDGYAEAFVGTDTSGYMGMYMGGASGLRDDAGAQVSPAGYAQWISP